MRVYIVSPAHIATGGTELLHQFSKNLSDNGIENYMIYVNADGIHCPTPEAFKKYNVKYVGSYADADDAVLVLPEGCLSLKCKSECIKGTIMVWWLSVDNYLQSCSNLIIANDLDVFGLKNIGNIVHFVQSQYAKEFLREQMGIKDSYYLMDYINEEILETAALYRNIKYERKNICLYNPRKGYETLKPVMAACREDIIWMPLEDYTPKEMATLMCMSKVYVDFGNHPGKDRIPREAAICGCCVITNRKGSAAYQKDVAIPECYKVENTEDINGVLEIIYTLVDDYEKKQNDFSEYRERIAGEKSEFMRDFQNAVDILEKSVTLHKAQKRKPCTCRICGAEGDFDTYLVQRKIQDTRKGFWYFVCGRCGCLQIAAVPSNLGEYYRSSYDSLQVSGDSSMEFETPVTHMEKVLDVGCGAGDWLVQMAKSGWGNLYGCDPFLKNDCQYGTRVTIRSCSIHEMEGDGTYDAIRMKDCFEHMEAPLEVLKCVWRLLKPGGRLYMSIPIYPNIAFERYGTHWHQMDAPRHIFLHSRKSLEWLSRESGMAISGFRYDSDNSQFIRSFFAQRGVFSDKQTPEMIRRHYGSEDIQRLQQEAEFWNEKEYGDHVEVSWQKSTIEAVKYGRKVIYQRFPYNVGGRCFPYPPLYRETDTDYICFTDNIKVHSSAWKIQIVEDVAQADLEPWLGQYAVRWELQPEQIQMGSLAEVYAGENAVAVPKLEEMPLVKFEPEKLISTADEEGRYIYRKNPVYNDGKYNGRPLLLTIGVPVSNQIDTIDRCLSHVKPLLEQLDAELLVVDTGSTDGTVEVCRSYGARVINYPWCDNMSAVRNAGIYNARGEWYLSIDDDEWFEDVEDILKFFSQGSHQNYDWATYIQRNYRDSAGTIYDNYHTRRVARITPGLHFEGRIHDALVAEPGLKRVCVLHSYAHHYGFVSDDPKRRQGKFLRNATLLLQDVYEYPENLRYLFQMAQEYASVQQNTTAVSLFLKTIAMAKEMGSKSQGKNSVVILFNILYAMKDQRLFRWAKCILSLFPLSAAERAYIVWCQQTLAFLTGKTPQQVLEYYGLYESALEEYRKDPALNQRLTYFGLMAVEEEPCIMDARAMAFCSHMGAGREEDALEILLHISLEKIPEQRTSVLALGFTAGDKVYEEVCSKIAPMQWEEWKEEILNTFAAGIRNDSFYKQQIERLSGLLSRMSVPAIRSWFGHAGEKRGGKTGGRLLEYAMKCEPEENSIQALYLCAEVLKEAYVQNRKGENGKKIFYRYLFILAVFAEHYYNQELLIDAEDRTIPSDIRAAYRMAVVLADGKASHENVMLLKQALAIFPGFHEEIRGILAELC